MSVGKDTWVASVLYSNISGDAYDGFLSSPKIRMLFNAEGFPGTKGSNTLEFKDITLGSLR